MTKLQEGKSACLEFGEHFWVFHQSMVFLKKENKVGGLDCWKKRGHWFFALKIRENFLPFPWGDTDLVENAWYNGYYFFMMLPRLELYSFTIWDYDLKIKYLLVLDFITALQLCKKRNSWHRLSVDSL